MGNEVSAASCTSPPNPDTTNQCSLYQGQQYRLPNFCSLAGLGGKNNRITWCGKLGTNEWGVNDFGGDGDCTYDDCGAYRATTSGCCKGCCGIAGRGVRCVRQQFNGDPLTCCLQDLECNGGLPTTGEGGSPAACFSDTNKKLTCDPCHRSITSSPDTLVQKDASGATTTCAERGVSSCQELLLPYCSGEGVDDDSWFERWQDPVTGEPRQCVRALERNLFSNFPSNTKCQTVGGFNLTGTCRPITTPATTTGQEAGGAGVNINALSASGVEWGQQLMAAVFAKYASQGFVVGSVPGQQGYNPFQNLLYSICCNAPIICQSSLQSTCSVYTTQRLATQPEAANWCGCYLPDIEYQQYVDAYQIDKQCTPTCNRLSTIPLVAGDNTAILCTQTVCLIDNVTLTLNSSNLNGGTNIAQVCGNCSGSPGSTGSCNCIVQNVTVEAANAQLGSINLFNSCSGTTCTVANPGGFPKLPPTLPVPCDTPSDPQTVYQAAQEQLDQDELLGNRRRLAWILVGVVIFLLLLVGLWYVIRPSTDGPKAITRTVTIPEKKLVPGVKGPDQIGYRPVRAPGAAIPGGQTGKPGTLTLGENTGPLGTGLKAGADTGSLRL